jgi:CheY-like chemotaxis protein
MKILIVDDNLIQRKVLEYNLTKFNYSVEVVAGGKEAMRVLENRADVGLVITDIVMPEGNGLELLSLMKSNAKLNGIPVILCTSLSDSENIKKAARLGCRFYIVKPMQVKVLLNMVQEALEDHKRVLRDFEESRLKLGMDRPAFYPLIVEFEKSVNATILLAEQKIKSMNMDSMDLATLHENAVMLGAERLSNILADIQSGVNLSMTQNEDYQSMLNELKVLSFNLGKTIAENSCAI